MILMMTTTTTIWISLGNDSVSMCEYYPRLACFSLEAIPYVYKSSSLCVPQAWVVFSLLLPFFPRRYELFVSSVLLEVKTSVASKRGPK